MKKVLRDITQSKAPSDYLDYRIFLKALYKEAKKRLPDYTYPKFSADLGLSESNVAWMIINKRRKLTSVTTKRVVESLKLAGKERRYFETLVNYNNAKKKEREEEAFKELIAIKKSTLQSNDELKMLDYYSEWHHPIIRELVGDESIDQDPASIAKMFHFPIQPQQVEKSFELLSSIGLITWDETKKRFVQTGGQIKPSQKVAKIAHVKYHEKVIDLSKLSITKVPKKKRDLNSLTVRLSGQEAEQVQKMIHDLCEKILEIEENSSQSGDGFQVNIQMFQLTKKD